jgi:hypothetical protein
MAVTITLGAVLQTNHWTTNGDQAATNVGHWVCNGVAGAPTTDADAAAYFASQFALAYIGLMPSQASYRGCQVRVISTTPLPVSQLSIAGQGPGSYGSQLLPRQCAGLIALYTTLAGRQGRGRRYSPFPSALGQQPTIDAPTASYVALLQTWGALWASSYTIPNFATSGTATVYPVLYNRTTKVWTVITLEVVREAWATQRRRGDFGRANTSPI